MKFKKLLSLLGVLTLSSTISLSVVACDNSQVHTDPLLINNYIGQELGFYSFDSYSSQYNSNFTEQISLNKDDNSWMWKLEKNAIFDKLNLFKLLKPDLENPGKFDPVEQIAKNFLSSMNFNVQSGQNYYSDENTNSITNTLIRPDSNNLINTGSIVTDAIKSRFGIMHSTLNVNFIQDSKIILSKHVIIADNNNIMTNPLTDINKSDFDKMLKSDFITNNYAKGKDITSFKNKLYEQISYNDYYNEVPDLLKKLGDFIGYKFTIDIVSYDDPTAPLMSGNFKEHLQYGIVIKFGEIAQDHTSWLEQIPGNK